MPSGKKARQQRKAAAPPPPVRSKGVGGRQFQVSQRTLLIAVAVIALAGIGIALGVGLSGGGGGATSGSVVDFSQIADLQNGPPPWNNGNAGLQENLSIVHLNQLSMEGSVLHIHQHLDVYVNGTHVTVPEGVGIFGNSWLTEIHTHDTSGIIHVESPTSTTFRLGQFFGEWAVRLSATCLGKYCGDLHWWVNGQPQTGDPAGLALSEHQEIVIAVGKAPAHIPSSYNFPSGL